MASLATPAGIPPAPPLVLSGNTQYPQIKPSPDEFSIFYRDFVRMSTIYSLQRDLSELLFSDADTYASIVGIAKGSIGTNPVFRGVVAQGGEIGFQLIRAITVENPGIASGGTPVQNWIKTYTATGWQGIFGSATSKIDLSQFGTGGSSATNTNGRVMLAFGALLNPVTSPKVSEIQITVGSLTYPIWNIDWEPAGDLFYAKLPGVVLVPVNQNFYINGNIQPSTGQDATQLFGLTFATGTYLGLES